MEKNQEREGEELPILSTRPYPTKPRSNFRSKLINLLIILCVVAVGLFLVNQFLAYRYKAVLFSTPCDVCLELNPLLEPCFKNELTIYQDPVTKEQLNKSEVKEKYFMEFNLSKYITEED